MARGDGRVFRRGARWAIDYYAPGPDGRKKKFRESAGDSEKEARALLRERLRQIGNDRVGLEQFTPPSAGRIVMSDLLNDVQKDYERKGLKSLRTLKAHQKRPLAAFGMKPARAVTTKVVEGYIDSRLAEGAKPATVDRELETVQRAFSLAAERGVRLFQPHIPKLQKKHANAREGFFERADYDAILAEIPDEDFRDLLEFFWWTGMRPKEICSLTWAADDGESIRLATKNAKVQGRVIPYDSGPLAIVMERRLTRKTTSPLIFHRKGRTMAGTTGGFKRHLREMWREACAKTGLTGAIPYDLRRTAIRNMMNGGANMKTAMLISGHLTTDTFMRYMIVDTVDQAAALKGADVWVQTHKKDRNVLRFSIGNGSKDGSSTVKK
jgi:integrase